ncbi:HIT family protein [Paenibacillus ferrarius]|uniref:HIT family protein n=1 Tax=Paenibacillus ferrarius TaxID=1469647 RepID=UPI003D26A358
MSSACLGCQLANGEVQAHVIYENERITCLLDIAPINEGHVLIMPKRHIVEVEEIDEETMRAVFSAAAQISRGLKACFAPDGISMMQNGGMFNDLGHYHLHVFPRNQGDGFAWVEANAVNEAAKRLAETRLKLINHIN